VITPEDVHNVAFSKPPIGQRGYNQDEVDAFLNRVEATLRDPTAGVTPADVRNVAFSKPPFGLRGYNADEVRAFLDVVEMELTRRAADDGGPRDVGKPSVLPQPTRRRRGKTVEVTGPDSVRWSVYRRWGVKHWDATTYSQSVGDELIMGTINLLQVIVMWPPWFIAKWLGVRWKIVIERDGIEAGEALVRGWRKSQRCIQEIAEMAAAGTLQQEIAAG
jgi:DivIVA domain-containing protein